MIIERKGKERGGKGRKGKERKGNDYKHIKCGHETILVRRPYAQRRARRKEGRRAHG